MSRAHPRLEGGPDDPPNSVADRDTGHELWFLLRGRLVDSDVSDHESSFDTVTPTLQNTYLRIEGVFKVRRTR